MCFPSVLRMILHDSTTSSQTVGADRTWALSFPHSITNKLHPPWTNELRRMELVTELNIDEIFFPADLAFGRMLLAHLS